MPKCSLTLDFRLTLCHPESCDALDAVLVQDPSQTG